MGKIMKLIAMMDFPKQPITMHFRIVLYESEGEYITWMQEIGRSKNRVYGHYFKELTDAMTDFILRCDTNIKYEITRG